MAKLPKSIIKKYGISKKAWSVFRHKRKSRSSVRRVTPRKIRHRRSFHMARRKFKSHRRNNSLVGGTVGKVLMSALGVVLWETVVSPRLPFGQYKNAAEAAIGLFVLAKMRNPFIRNTGLALATVNSVLLLAPLASKIAPQVTLNSNGATF